MANRWKAEFDSITKIEKFGSHWHHQLRWHKCIFQKNWMTNMESSFKCSSFNFCSVSLYIRRLALCLQWRSSIRNEYQRAKLIRQNNNSVDTFRKNYSHRTTSENEMWFITGCLLNINSFYCVLFSSHGCE